MRGMRRHLRIQRVQGHGHRRHQAEERILRALSMVCNPMCHEPPCACYLRFSKETQGHKARRDEGNVCLDLFLVGAIYSLLVSAWEQLPTERSCQLWLWLWTTLCSSGTLCADSLRSVALRWSQPPTGRKHSKC